MKNPFLPPQRKSKKRIFMEAFLTGGFVYQIGESPILRKSTKEVNPKIITTKPFQEKLSYLKRCFLKYRKLTGLGRGMAAPQVGISERFALIYTQEGIIVIINPKITKSSSRKLLYPEICMSAYPISAPVVRPSWIEFDYFDECGNLKKWDIKDKTKLGKILNRVAEHEIDHLGGIINIDRVASRDLGFEFNPKFYLRSKFKRA